METMTPRGILSVGLIIREVLSLNEPVRALTQNVYPLNMDEVEMPYVAYARTGLDSTAVKDGRPSNKALITLECVAASYAESVALAEAVYRALEGCRRELSDGSLQMRSCMCVDASEGIADGEYVQELVFEVRV